MILHHRLNSCLVICTMSLCYVLHQTLLELWHIQYSILSSIFHANLRPKEALTRHVKNPPKGNCSAISEHIENLVQCLHLQKPGESEIPEPFLNCIPTYIENPVIFAKTFEYSTLTYLKHDKYSESSQRLKMMFFAKIVKNYNYFCKVLHGKFLIGFWIRASLNKYFYSDLALCNVRDIFRTLSII